jgi:hypothetical protein
MAETTYSYTFASFPNNIVASARLNQQILESSIVTALQAININVSAESVDIVFKAELSDADKTTLDGDAGQAPNPATPCPTGSLVGDHDGVPLPSTAFRADGVQLVQLEPAGETAQLRADGVHGYPAPAVIDGTPVKTSIQWTAPAVIQFQGIPWVDVRNFDDRDYMDLCLVFPEDSTRAEWEGLGILGPWPFGPADTPAQAAQPDVVLTRFGNHIYIPKDGHLFGEVAEGTSRIAPPLTLSIDYYSFAVAGPEPIRLAGIIRYWEE